MLNVSSCEKNADEIEFASDCGFTHDMSGPSFFQHLPAYDQGEKVSPFKGKSGPNRAKRVPMVTCEFHARAPTPER